MSSNQGYYDQSGEHHNFATNNPWSQEVSPSNNQQHAPSYVAAGAPEQQAWQQQAQQEHPQSNPSGYVPPSGPPPGHQQPPARSATFEETDFISESERGEQREAMEQFEMNKAASGARETQQDRDVATLQAEFPGVDSALIAALYSDTGSLGPTREMLQELQGSGGAS